MKSHLRLVPLISFIILVPLYLLLFFYYDPQISRWAVSIVKDGGLSSAELLVFSDTAGHVPFFFFGLVLFSVAVLPGGSRQSGCWRSKVLYIAASMGIAVCLYGALKYTFGRYRPAELFNNLYGFNWLQGTQYSRESTPSGHTVRAFVLAVALSRVIEKRWITFLLLAYAVCIAASRVLLGAHFLSDVLFGSWVGTTCAILLYPFFMNAQKDSTQSLQR